MVDNISRYVSFVAVAKHGSFSSAAKALYVSQPALSADISKLESELGTKLFFRTGRGIRLTEAGELLYEYATGALSLMETGEDKLRDLLDLKGGHLTVGASDMTLRFFLLDYISVFRKKYPEVKIKITNAPSPKTVSALKKGEIDIGVITSAGNTDVLHDIELRRVRLIRDIFVCHPDCPLSRQEKVTAEELSAYPLIMLEGETSTVKYIRRIMPELRKADIELATSDLVAEFASRNFGVATVVEDFAKPFIDKGELAVIDLSLPLPPRHMYIATLKNIPLSAAAGRLIEIIEKENNTQMRERNI